MDRQEILKMSNELFLCTYTCRLVNCLMFGFYEYYLLLLTEQYVTKQYFPFLITCYSRQFFRSNLIAHHLHWAQSQSFICSSYYCCFLVAVVVVVIVDAAVVVFARSSPKLSVKVYS